MRALPGVRFLYYGDNRRAPYGGREEGEVAEFTARAFFRLMRFPLAAAVIACNTATAAAADVLRQDCPFPVVGLEPALRPAAARARRVLVLATPATLASARFAALAARVKGECLLLSFAPARLAGEIEKNIFCLQKIRLEEHLPPVSCDEVVLGCTHYVFLKERISAYYGVPASDGNAGAAARLASLLQGRFCENVGRDSHQTAKTNKCSKNRQKLQKNRVIFLGKSKNFNKKVFYSLF